MTTQDSKINFLTNCVPKASFGIVAFWIVLRDNVFLDSGIYSNNRFYLVIRTCTCTSEPAKMSINSTSSERYIKIIRVVRLQIKTLLLTERDLGLVSEEYFDDGKQRQADESVQKVDNFLRGFFDLFVALSNDSPKVFLEQNQAESDRKLSKIHSSRPTEQNEKIESTFLFHRQYSPENVSFENLKPFADVQLPTDEDLSEEIQIGDELFHFNTRTK